MQSCYFFTSIPQVLQEAFTTLNSKCNNIFTCPQMATKSTMILIRRRDSLLFRENKAGKKINVLLVQKQEIISTTYENFENGKWITPLTQKCYKYYSYIYLTLIEFWIQKSTFELWTDMKTGNWDKTNFGKCFRHCQPKVCVYFEFAKESRHDKKGNES